MSTEHEAAYTQLGRAFANVLRLEMAGALPAIPIVSAEPEAVKLLTLDEFAERIGLSLNSARALVGREVPPIYQGRAVRVASDDVDAYITRLRGQSRQHVQGEPVMPIDLGKSRRHRAASSAAGRARSAGKKKAALSGN